MSEVGMNQKIVSGKLRAGMASKATLSMVVAGLLCLGKVHAAIIANDDFSNGDYSGGTGWTGDWLEEGQGCTDVDCTEDTTSDPAEGVLRVINEELRMIGATGVDPTVKRTVNTTGAASATLSFTREGIGGLDTTDDYEVCWSANVAGPFTDCVSYSDDPTPNNPNLEIIDISSAIGPTTTIRFEITANIIGTPPNPTEQLLIDNIEVDVPSIEDDFAIADVDETVDIQVTNNDSTQIADSICIENPANTCDADGILVVPEGTFSVQPGDVIRFEPNVGFSGIVTPINYLADSTLGGGSQISAEIRVLINERSLCTADGTIEPYVMGNPAGTDNLVVFQVQNTPADGFTGDSQLEVDHDVQAGIQNSDADPSNDVGLVNQINSFGLDTARNFAFYHDNAQVDSPETLFMFDANTGEIFEIIGPNAPAGYPSDYSTVLAGTGEDLCGTELGGAAGEYFGGSFYFGVEQDQGCGGAPDSDGTAFDRIFRMDFDFSVYPPQPIVPATLIWTFDPAAQGGVGSGTAHDWGDILVSPEDPDGIPGTGDEQIILIDFDRNATTVGAANDDDFVTRIDITDPDNPVFLEANAVAPNTIGQAAISFDGTAYAFLASGDEISTIDVEGVAFDGDGVGLEGSAIEIAGPDWPDTLPAVDGSSCVDPTGSLPVTLGHFESRETNNRIRVKWQTLTETFTVGFHIWGKVNGEWLQLNNKLLRTKRLDSVVPQNYRTSVRTRGLDGPVTDLALTSVDLNGYEEGYGPFEPGESYGEETAFEPVPWNTIGAEYHNRMTQQGYAWINNKWRKLNKGREKKLARLAERAEDLADIAIAEDGMVRVTYEDLLAAGIDMEGVKEKTIAVTWKGMPVPRHVAGPGNRFGPGSEVHFFGEAPKGSDALYIAENIYQVGLDETSALPIKKINRKPHGAIDSYLATSMVEEDVSYANLLPTGDPFHMGIIFAGSGGGLFPAAANPALTIDVSPDVDTTVPAYVEVRMAAITDFPGEDDNPADGQVDPDHSVSIVINGTPALLENGMFEGYGDWLVTGMIPAGVLSPGVNELRIETLPTGYTGSTLKALDHYAVHYVRNGVAEDDSIQIGAVNQVLGEGSEADGFEISGFSQKKLVAYVYSPSANDHPGNLQRLHVRSKPDAEGFIAQIPTVGDDTARYWISTEERLNSPASISPAQASHELLSESGDYILIAHPNFLPPNPGNHPLNDYVVAKQSEGYNPLLVDLDHIVDDFGYGMKTPDAITNYLRAAAETFDYTHVLLVGGDVNDYLDKAGSGAISFIPTKYTHTGDLIQYTPTDALMVDFDGDEYSDKALGRWPVRTLTELETIVAKTLVFSDPVTGMFDDRLALLIAEEITAQEGYDFSAQMERLNTKLKSFVDDPANPVLWDDTADAVDRVYVQDLIDGGDPTPYATARGMIYDGINAADGQTMTIFGGHGSPAAWSFNLLLQSSDVAENLNNVGKPTLMMPMACYTTYYNETHTNTLAHQLLLSGDKGAAAIHAAATLSGYNDNEAMGTAILEYQLKDGDTLGVAVERARRLTTDRDVRINWTVLYRSAPNIWRLVSNVLSLSQTSARRC